MRVRSLTKLNLSWAVPGALIIKRYFESGSEFRQAVTNTVVLNSVSHFFVNMSFRRLCYTIVGDSKS